MFVSQPVVADRGPRRDLLRRLPWDETFSLTEKKREATRQPHTWRVRQHRGTLKRKVLESSTIIDKCITIINNSHWNHYIIFLNKHLLEECDNEQNVAVAGLLLLLPVQRKNVKRSVQCHVLAQSPPGRGPNDKYPVNTSHRSDLCKNVSLQCYLVATVIHIVSKQSRVCTHTHTHTHIHIVHNMETTMG